MPAVTFYSYEQVLEVPPRIHTFINFVQKWLFIDHNVMKFKINTARIKIPVIIILPGNALQI